MENQYFEDNSQVKVNEDDIIKRIKECEMVVDKLSTNDVWSIVLKDCNAWSRHIDGLWQDVQDEDKLKQMRVLKLAYKHILNVPKQYKDELEQLKEELSKSNEIQKDYED